ncbi:MAG TPA: hypothetical protein VN132_05990, partial [Bdellovibrio sp.]|nr:hypothetical protein [Bdellovibrio sp.]
MKIENSLQEVEFRSKLGRRGEFVHLNFIPFRAHMNRGRRRCLLMLAMLLVQVPLVTAASAEARPPNKETHMD